ncbi:hypothetical protein CR513_36262, partial [Mucuna pruriens]
MLTLELDADLKAQADSHLIRKTKNINVGHSSGSFNSVAKADTFENKPEIVDNPLYKLEPMENNNRTLKELATPDVLYHPWCIQYPQLELARLYELKSRFIHLLPKFHNLIGEDPYKHLKEFHVGIPEDDIKMKVFPFSLDGATKDWF